MKVTLRFSSLFFGLVLWSATAWAQPDNDLCQNAVELTVYDSEAEAVRVEGDTRNTTDGALDLIPVCSANFYRDDVWYKVTAPAVVSEAGYTVKVYFNESAEDIDSVGIAIYNSCDADPSNVALFCANSPADDQASLCLSEGQEVFIRIWSAQGTAANWQVGAGTFRIAVFPRQFEGGNTSVVLWGDIPGQGDFDGGLNDWTTEGLLCNGGAPSENAQWVWTSTGFPVYVFGGETISSINSKTFCNGSVIFDSGYLEFGDAGTAGSGTCPWDDHEGALISPVIDLSEFNSPGVSVIFNQSMQRFINGLHFLDFSLDGGATWEAIQINDEKTYLSTNPQTGGGYFNEEYRVRLPGAQGASELRLRFRFSGGAYWWVIDDVRIVETEANNVNVQSNFFAIAPWANVPADQVYPYGSLADIRNAGAADQTNVVLNHTVTNTATQEEIYNEDLSYGTVIPDTVIENRLHPELIVVPPVAADYVGTYTLTQDQEDFDPSDNVISYNFSVGEDVFALESGFTRSVAVAETIYDDGAPLSYAYGNYFRPVVDFEVGNITWGASNPADMDGITVNIYLLQWNDTNGDLIAESNERRFVGLGEYTFSGSEPENVIIATTLENFDNPGDPIIMRGGFGYIAIVEYQASTGEDPQFFLLASEERDYNAAVLAGDTAVAWGLTDQRVFSSVLGFSPDGNIANIDYEVRELDGTDARIFFGHDIVPFVRVVGVTNNTVDVLPIDNLISAFPNPANDKIQVKLEFTQPYSDVRLRLIDQQGRVVFFRNLPQTFSEHVETISVNELPSGNYILQVETVDGQRSVPVIVVK